MCPENNRVQAQAMQAPIYHDFQMFKLFREKWQMWEEAILRADDLHGDYLIALENRRDGGGCVECSVRPGNRA
ncbi:hypothetical protein [Agrobacterium sp. V1]|uniref:hypothetical protein n=1 Tax=Agrobacterium sp. V1 TaxID=3061957 RepID=UPI002672630A|nr:hypothetical protein [Agrobacterium sp. V1]MDO3445391.1 hypothetical protein [Agrobacterium sp. V1]